MATGRLGRRGSGACRSGELLSWTSFPVLGWAGRSAAGSPRLAAHTRPPGGWWLAGGWRSFAFRRGGGGRASAMPFAPFSIARGVEEGRRGPVADRRRRAGQRERAYRVAVTGVAGVGDAEHREGDRPLRWADAAG